MEKSVIKILLLRSLAAFVKIQNRIFEFISKTYQYRGGKRERKGKRD